MGKLPPQADAHIYIKAQRHKLFTKCGDMLQGFKFLLFQCLYYLNHVEFPPFSDCDYVI